jgi:hypothetical protein
LKTKEKAVRLFLWRPAFGIRFSFTLSDGEVADQSVGSKKLWFKLRLYISYQHKILISNTRLSAPLILCALNSKRFAEKNLYVLVQRNGRTTVFQ